MRIQALLALTASLVPSVLAVFADDAYQIDYHHALLGIPLTHTTFFQPPYAGSKASLLYSLSEKHLLGAVNPKDGSLVWRQSLVAPSNASIGLLRAGEDQDTVVSALGNQVAAWSASDGKLVWEQKFGDEEVQDLEILELPEPETSKNAKDILLLSNGDTPTVRRLSGETGITRWSFGDNSGSLPLQVSASATNVFYVSLHSKMLGGLKIQVITLDPVTGSKSDLQTLNTEKDVSAAEDVLFVGANSASPIVAWTDKARKSLKVNILGTKDISSISIDNSSGEEIEQIFLHAPQRTNAVTHFLVHYQTANHHWAEVYHIDLTKTSVKKAYSLPSLAGKGTFATSTSDANVYFTRIAKGGIVVVSSASHGVLARWIPNSFGVPALLDYPDPVHAVSEVAPRAGSHAVRSAVLLSSGDWVLMRNGETNWARHEALAGLATVTFAELPVKEGLSRELQIESHQNVLAAYAHRWKRHIKGLENLVQWIQSAPGRLLKFTFHSEATDASEINKPDAFGFHKLVVVITDNGRIAALDTGSAGKLVWSAKLPLSEPGPTVEAPKLHVYPNGAVRVKQNGEYFVFEIQTGKLLRKGRSKEKEPGTKHSETDKTIIAYNLVDGELQGSVAGQSPSSVWTFAPAPGERIVGVSARPTEDPVASIGKVLGDRRVLYKYLNPNLVLVTAVADARNVASVYLLDSVSGAVLYTATHPGVDTTRPIASTVSENWLAYSFTVDASSTSSSKGHHLAVAELFESTLPDDRGSMGSAANYSSLQPSTSIGDNMPHVLSQIYHIPEEISHMTVSQTTQGITSRILLASLPESKSIVGIPRYVIDPRRPVGREPTSLEQNEGLMRYIPTIEFDPKWDLNHKREVLGIEKMLTSPSLLESTGLVFVYGHDIFGTRVSPSFTFDVLGKGFNKLQMLATVAALAVGVFVVAPLVRRKQINARWQL